MRHLLGQWLAIWLSYIHRKKVGEGQEVRVRQSAETFLERSRQRMEGVSIMSQLKGGKLKRVSLAPRNKKDVEAQAIKFFNDSKSNVNFTLEQIKESFFREEKRNETLEVYANSIYMVFVDRQTDLADGELKNKITHLSIKRKDKRPCNSWADFQAIKNELVGEEVDAVEVYPKESNLVNTANQYHLWCFPPDLRLGFGFQARATVEKNIESEDGDGQVGQTFKK